MRSGNFMKGLAGSALVAAALAFSASANADTQLIHFDDAINGWQWYSTSDRNFTLDPVNLSSTSLCADTTEASGNGSCALEGGQGVLPLLVRPQDENQTESQGSSGANAEPDFNNGGPGTLQAFTLDSFYFLLNGSGTGNTMTVCGGTGAPPSPDIETIDGTPGGVPSAICDGYYSFTFYEDGGVAYTGPAADDPGSLPVVTYYEDYAGRGDSAAVEGEVATTLAKNTGYIATFSDLFADVTWIQWTANGDAQFRLDCIVVSADDLTTTEPLSGFSDYGCGGSSTVPEPGTLALFGMGLLGMGLSRRFRRVHRPV